MGLSAASVSYTHLDVYKRQILISTHMLEMVENMWDVMFVMEKGHIIGSYNKEEVGDKELDDLFFELTGGEKEMCIRDRF